MTAEEYSCLEYWRKRYMKEEPRMAFRGRDLEAYEAWKPAFQKKFIDCLGRMPSDQVPLDTLVLEKEETEWYTRTKVVYRADEFSKIPAYLFVPKDRAFPLPAVLCPHGHGRGKVDPAGIADGAQDEAHLAKYNYDYAVQFAKEGFVTLAPDLRCFGERVDDPSEVYGFMEIEEGNHWCDINFVLGMLLGYNLLTLHVFDIGRGIDFLQSLEAVAAERIGCVGLSQGGTTTLFSTAYHDRIKVAGVSGYLNSWKNFPLGSGQICGSQIVPGLLEFGDHPEVAGLIAPRPLFLEFGIKDPIFPIKGSRETYRRVKDIYSILGAEDRLELEEFDGPHEFRGKRIFEFFRKWLYVK
ncbi:MAG TPA: alpha/beta hydrolase family protein [Spirochaetia bacterium]|nr:alpha/beta hydrolase family protein [Spirochaetia bacterium]